MDADFHLDAEAWLSLAVGVLMLAAGLIALLAPLRHLGGQQRPWLVICLFLPMGLLRIVATLAEAAGVEGIAPVLVVLQIVILVGVFVLGVSYLQRLRQQAAHSPQPPPIEAGLRGTALEDEVGRFLAAGGNKIQAVVRVRELTGMGLREAKNLVDRAGAPRRG